MYLQLQAGKIDRAQYNAAYCAGITDDAVQAMSRRLQPIRRLAAARGRPEKHGRQPDFYVMELLFPRGDAASLLFSFDTEGKIAGVAVDRRGRGLTETERKLRKPYQIDDVVAPVIESWVS